MKPKLLTDLFMAKFSSALHAFIELWEEEQLKKANGESDNFETMLVIPWHMYFEDHQ